MSASKFGFFLLLSLIFFGSSQLQAKPFYAEENTVSVVGYGMVEVEPNEMRFHFGVDAKDPEVNVAYKRVESTLAKALKLLARMGVPSQQIQAMTAQINPIIDYKSRDQRHIGYEVRRDVNVKVDNLELYAKALAELAELGVTRFGQVQMRVSNRQALEINALEKAYTHAENKAKSLAKRAGRELGDVLVMVEHGAQPALPSPVFKARTMAMAEGLSADAATVSAGQISVEKRIQVTFLLK